MNEEKVLSNAEYGENHENDDMIAQHAVKSDETISFSVSDEARPQHTWTKKQKRTVWIAAVVAVVLFIAVSFCSALRGLICSVCLAVILRCSKV